MSATDAARRFADLLNRAVYRGQRFLVERGGKAAVEIRPVREAPVSFSELVSILRSAPRPDTDFGDDLEAVTRAQAGISASPWES